MKTSENFCLLMVMFRRRTFWSCCIVLDLADRSS